MPLLNTTLYDLYKNTLYSYRKKLFDSFNRYNTNVSITFEGRTEEKTVKVSAVYDDKAHCVRFHPSFVKLSQPSIEASVGQLNFLKWISENGIATLSLPHKAELEAMTKEKKLKTKARPHYKVHSKPFQLPPT
jgi:hypothetical protein